ncbi:MAG: alpha/beta hydrolase [Steroidobacteraceae bacterium]
MNRSTLWPSLLLAAVLFPFTASAAPSLRVGSIDLGACPTSGAMPPRAWCGHLQRPLDPANPKAGTLDVHFEYYRHTAPGRSFGVMVAAEGGPGYPSTGSREAYYALYAPLKDRNDLLLMDNRGTGRSGAVDCPALQQAAQATRELIGECGARLGERAAYYSTVNAADDLAAILEALQMPKADLYGDSYGTYFAQVFATRHGAMLRSLVLDGAYPLQGPDYAWYPNYARAMRAKFNVACSRSPHCASLAGDSISHIRPALEKLRRQPHAASAVDADGKPREFIADAARLAWVMFTSAPAYASLRETDAAARAYASGDEAPLLRLMAETTAGVDSRDPSNDPRAWSAGLAAAVMCQDPPQLFDLAVPRAERVEQLSHAIESFLGAHPDHFAPFRLDEYRGLPPDYAFIDQCLEWPPVDSRHASPLVAPAASSYPGIPVLVISGEFDNLTPVADAAAAAAAFPHARHLILANSFHVNALPRGRSDCAMQVAQRFLATLDPGDMACAWQVPEVPLAPDFARHVQEVEPAQAQAPNEAGESPRRCAAAAVLTAADVLTRVRANGSGQGTGLRGGRFRITGPEQDRRIELDEVRWTEDLAVSGELHWRGPRAAVNATLRLSGEGPCGAGELQVQWPQEKNQDASPSRASITGRIGDVEILAGLPAP